MWRLEIIIQLNDMSAALILSEALGFILCGGDSKEEAPKTDSAIFSRRHHGVNECSGRCSQEHQQRGEEGQTPGPHQAVFQSHRSVPDCDDEAWLHW